MFESLVSRKGLSLERLHTFLAVAEAGSIAAVTQGDASRQSLASRQIRELSEYFGVELTRRAGKGIELTEAGHELATAVRQQFQLLEDLQATFAAERAVLRLGAGNSVLEWLVAPILGRLLKAHPRVSFDLADCRTSEVIRGLRESRLDLGIIRKDALSREFKSWPVATLDYALYVPKRLGPVPSGQKALKAWVHSLPLATSRGGSFRQSVAREAAATGWTLSFALECASFTQAARAAATNELAALLPTIAEPAMDMRRIRRIDLPFLKTYRRNLVLAANPRTLETRPLASKAAERLYAALQELS